MWRLLFRKSRRYILQAENFVLLGFVNFDSAVQFRRLLYHRHRLRCLLLRRRHPDIYLQHWLRSRKSQVIIVFGKNRLPPYRCWCLLPLIVLPGADCCPKLDCPYLPGWAIVSFYAGAGWSSPETRYGCTFSAMTDPLTDGQRRRLIVQPPMAGLPRHSSHLIQVWNAWTGLWCGTMI